MNNKIVAGIIILVLAGAVTANVLKPTTWGSGYKLYNVNGSYWDLMGENGIQNGSLTNMTYINATTGIFTGVVTVGTLNVTTASLVGNKEVHWILVRFVAGGAVQMNKMYFPYNVTINKMRGVVAVDIGATDNGTIIFANSAGNMSGASITAVANDTVGTEYTGIPTTNNTVTKDSYMTVNLTKVTGDGQVMLGIEMTRST